MKRGGLPKKFLSRRDKNGHHRSRSSDPATHKHRPLSAEAFFGLFKIDATKRSANDDETREEKVASKILEVRRQVADLELLNLKDDHIQYALNTKYSGGDVSKAIEFLVLQQRSLSGTLLPYDPNVHMLGAENREAVTCYLDALLFAMFAKLESFECMLKGESLDEAPKRLAALLRLWVNLLRSGKLIEADITQHIQDSLAACGWKEAQDLEQQDTSEAFAFITETLQLPLLTLKVDLFHQGKGDDADHKVVYERLLNLGVPPDTEGKGVKLEDCLEEYFNSQVDVLRDSLDEKKAAERSDMASSPLSVDTPTTPRAPMRFDNGDKPEEPIPESDDELELPHIERRWTTTLSSQGSGSQPSKRPNRARTESIIQRVVLDEEGKPTESDSASLFQRTKKRASVVKAVTIPAWQFFKLIPWHSPANKEPQNNLEVARHFRQRPVLGICLKRYMMDERGNAKRQNTFIDIPDSLRLPHFITDERQAEENELSAEYKLVLQSVVCHRGDSVHSGHYISFCRVAPKLLTDNRRHDKDPPPDYEEAQWVKFDDLSIEQRVTPVDDIKQSLREEMPYLLFYQIVPVIEVATSSADSTEAKPPSYDDTTINVAHSEASGHSQDRPAVSRQASSYFENLSALPSTNPSVRFSTELEAPSRHSFADEDGFLCVSRRDSAANLDSISPGHSPAPSPATEETTAQRLSRAASKFRNGSKSRPQSQAGEGRISMTISRLGGLVRQSKDTLRDSTTNVDTDEDYEILDSNGSVEKEKDVTVNNKQRGKSKSRADKGKGKESSKGKLDLPDRECVVQ